MNHVFAILALCAFSLKAWGADVPAPPKPADSNATAPAKEKTDAEKKAEAEAKAEEEARKIAATEDALAKAEAEMKKEKEEALAKIEKEYQAKLAEAAKKWKAATNKLGNFHEIAGRNPFGLQKEVITKPEYEEPVETIVVGKPQLAGISMVRGKVRALLRISPQAGGKSKYEFLEAEEMLEGVEVLNIDPVEGIVTVKMLGSGSTPDRTVALDLNEKKGKLSSTGGSSRRTSSRWGSRTSSRGSSSRGSSSSGSTGWKITKPGQETKTDKGTTPASTQEKTKEEAKQEETKKPSTPARPDGLNRVPTRRPSADE